MAIDGVSNSALFQMVKSTNKDGLVETKLIHKERPQDYEAPIVGGKEQKRVTKEELIHAVETTNESLKLYDRRLELSVHEETNQVIAKVIDTNTDKVIREVPSEKLLDMVAKMWEMAGIFVDEQA